MTIVKAFLNVAHRRCFTRWDLSLRWGTDNGPGCSWSETRPFRDWPTDSAGSV